MKTKRELWITFSFWSNKVDMPGPQRAARPLSRHFAGASNIAVLYRRKGWSQQGTLLQKNTKLECKYTMGYWCEVGMETKVMPYCIQPILIGFNISIIYTDQPICFILK